MPARPIDYVRCIRRTCKRCQRYSPLRGGKRISYSYFLCADCAKKTKA